MGTWVDNPSEFSINEFSWDLVSNRFDTAQAFSDEMKTLTINYIGNLVGYLGSLELPDTGDIDVEIPDVSPIDYTTRPTFGDIELPDNWPTVVPTKPTLNTIPDTEEITIPVFTVPAPSWDLPTKPTSSEVQEPGNEPILNEINIPAMPSLGVIPSAPTLHEVTIPSSPDVSIPTFNSEYVEDIINVPAGFSWEESPYNSDVWAAFFDNVMDGLINGGTGLPANIEAEIWQRAKDRQRIENDSKYVEVETYFSSRNHQLPPGALGGAVREIAESILLANQNLNSDIAIEQAKLTKEHQQFIMTIALDAEKVLRDFNDAMVNRSLEAAKEAISAGIDVYNARIEKQKLRLAKYEADATLYDSQIKGALAKVDLFTAQMEGAKVTAEVNKTITDVYTAQLGAIEVSAKLYTAKLEGYKLAQEIESLKLEAYGLSIQAYAERLKAEQLKYEAYNTEMEGEKIKAEAYSEQVRAFVAEVEAKRAESDIKIANLENAYKANTILIDGYKAELYGYSASIDAVAKKTGAIVDGFKAEVAGYSAETEATGMQYKTQMYEMDTNLNRAKILLEQSVAKIDATTKGYLGLADVTSNGLEGVAGMGAQLTSAAFSSVHASASLGTNSSGSINQNYSHGETISESHGYEHE